MGLQFNEPAILILTSLAKENMHGYAIMEDIQENYDYKIGPGTLYGAINRLEKQSFIRALEGDKRKRPYVLTMEGREYLQLRLEEMSTIVQKGMGRLGY